VGITAFEESTGTLPEIHVFLPQAVSQPPAREITEVNPAETYERVRSHVPSDADGVFIVDLS
jgi:hypothetical protein